MGIRSLLGLQGEGVQSEQQGSDTQPVLQPEQEPSVRPSLPPLPGKPYIRWMIRRDMPEVLAIERQSFKEEDQWTMEEFTRKLTRRDTLGLSIELDEKIVGSMIYRLHDLYVRLDNIAVHPDYRRRGILRECMLKLLSKLNHQSRTQLIVLLPESCLELQPVFESFGKDKVKILLTKKKGEITYEPVCAVMTTQDAEEAQAIEDAVLCEYSRKAREIGSLIANNSRYGFVARDKLSGILMGYVLYERTDKGIALNGEFSVIVGPEYRRHGIGRQLMAEVIKLRAPIMLYDVCLTCKLQCAFWRAMGVSVPKLQRFINIEWRPEQPAETDPSPAKSA